MVNMQVNTKDKCFFFKISLKNNILLREKILRVQKPAREYHSHPDNKKNTDDLKKKKTLLEPTKTSENKATN